MTYPNGTSRQPSTAARTLRRIANPPKTAPPVARVPRTATAGRLASDVSPGNESGRVFAGFRASERRRSARESRAGDDDDRRDHDGRPAGPHRATGRTGLPVGPAEPARSPAAPGDG